MQEKLSQLTVGAFQREDIDSEDCVTVLLDLSLSVSFIWLLYQYLEQYEARVAMPSSIASSFPSSSDLSQK